MEGLAVALLVIIINLASDALKPYVKKLAKHPQFFRYAIPFTMVLIVYIWTNEKERDSLCKVKPGLCKHLPQALDYAFDLLYFCVGKGAEYFSAIVACIVNTFFWTTGTTKRSFKTVAGAVSFAAYWITETFGPTLKTLVTVISLVLYFACLQILLNIWLRSFVDQAYGRRVFLADLLISVGVTIVLAWAYLDHLLTLLFFSSKF